ncbi:MAG: hypothetical protein KDA87_08265 [Planctomycetales bacterium]|nr:hypothetical protein [Planctomycetales bacterium]
MSNDRIHEHRLGRIVATYYPTGGLERRFLALAVTGLVGCTVLAWLHHGDLESILDSGWLWVGVMAMLLGSFGWLHFRRQSVTLYQDGICLEGWQPVCIPWDQLKEVYQVPVHSTNLFRMEEVLNWMYVLVHHEGHRIRLLGFDGIRGLGYRLQDELSNRYLEGMKTSFEAGRLLRFGKKLAISNEGLHVGMRIFGWHEVNDILIDESEDIRISYEDTRARTIRIAVGSVANLHLFIGILDWIQEHQPKSREHSDRFWEDSRAFGLIDEDDTLATARDPKDLLVQGFEWDEIDDVMRGDCTIEELLARGPRQRPRRPR